MKALVSLDSLATNWLEDNLVCQLQRTPEGPKINHDILKKK
jgi:hypothetical protein